MRLRSAKTLLASLAVGSIACGGSSAPKPTTPVAQAPAAASAPAAPPPVATETAVTIGVDEAALDRSVDPCQDFYAFACGGWQKATPIPEDRPAWSRGFSEVDERNQKILKGLLEKYVAGALASQPYAKKVADFYAACMDEAGIEKAGLEPVKPLFATIDALKDPKELASAVQALYLRGLPTIFGFMSGQDFADATQMIGQVDQGGLGLPDRDYYLEKGKKADELRKAYAEHVGKVLALAGLDEKGAAVVLEIEGQLAKASMSLEDRRDPKKVYHRMGLDGLQKLAPAFDWTGFVTGVGVDKAAPINVAQPDFVRQVGVLATRVKLDDWKTYLKWRVLHGLAPAMPKAFVDEDFRFRSQHLSGAKALLPRWKRCIDATNGAIGEAVAVPFVAATFGAEGKARTSSMIAEIEQAFERTLGALPWMDDPTRAKALEKLQKIKNKIGYPDRFRKYDGLEITPGAHASNVLSADAFELRRLLAKIGKPLDRGDWWMVPQMVNAYYDANMNEMVFPAGILQPPFFDRRATDAINYGAIGMVMGHELTHGFDDEGRKFDGDGNLKEWWTKSVDAEFDKRAACVVKQYDGYVALPDPEGKGADLKVKGKLTLGENIADLGGLKLAYAAYKEARKGKPDQGVGGFGEDQQFFLGYAQAWCMNARPQYRALRAKTDPHAPPQWRVNGPASNMPEFANAFQCKPGTPMVRKDRCEVW